MPYAIVLKHGIAYITITAFNENTAQGIDDKLKKLGEKNLKGLVLDLRDNPGGLLNEGIDVACHFLKKNEVVVSHHGRIQSNKSMRRAATAPARIIRWWCWSTGPASAAEIVTGALQDHDRGWILGEPRSARAWCRPCSRSATTPAWR